MKQPKYPPLLCAAALFLFSAAGVLLLGRAAEKSWLAPGAQDAPVTHDTAVEQVESELKSYPVRVLTLRTAALLYTDFSGSRQNDFLEADPDSAAVSAQKAAALAGEYALALYGRELSGQTADALLLSGKKGQPYWWIGIPQEDAQKAEDSLPAALCFRIDAADGRLLYSARLPQAEPDGTPVQSTLQRYDTLSYGTVSFLLQDALRRCEALSLSAQKCHIGVDGTADHGYLPQVFLLLEDDRACTLHYAAPDGTGGLYRFEAGEKNALLSLEPMLDEEFSFTSLPLQPEAAPQLPAAHELALQQDTGTLIPLNSLHVSTFFAAQKGVYLCEPVTVPHYRQLMYLDAQTGTRQVLCSREGCTHTTSACPACFSQLQYPIAVQDELYLYGQLDTGGEYSLRHLTAEGSWETLFAADQTRAPIQSMVLRADTLYATAFRDASTMCLERICLPQGKRETLTELPFPMQLAGSIGSRLLLTAGGRADLVITDDAGMHLTDPGFVNCIYAYDLDTGELTQLYKGTEFFHLQPAAGVRWLSPKEGQPLQYICFDLFTGEELCRFSPAEPQLKYPELHTELLAESGVLSCSSLPEYLCLLMADGQLYERRFSLPQHPLNRPVCAVNDSILFRIPATRDMGDFRYRYFLLPQAALSGAETAPAVTDIQDLFTYYPA